MNKKFFIVISAIIIFISASLGLDLSAAQAKSYSADGAWAYHNFLSTKKIKKVKKTKKKVKAKVKKTKKVKSIKVKKAKKKVRVKK